MKKSRQPRVSIKVIGEGRTEYYYIGHLKETRSYRFGVDPIMPDATDSFSLFRKAERMRREGKADIIFCLFDLDKILSDGLDGRFHNAIKRLRPEIIPIGSFPCIEFWFLLHFLGNPSARYYADGRTAERELRKHAAEYEKSDRYFRSGRFFSLINSVARQENAIRNDSFIRQRIPHDESVLEHSFSDIPLMISFLDRCSSCTSMDHCSVCISEIKEKLLTVRI